MTDQTPIAINIGSNVDKERCIPHAIRLLRRHPQIHIDVMSRVFRSESVGGPDDLFGETTVETAADGSFTLTAPAVPGLGGIPMTIEGTFTPDGFSGTYTIPDLAEGTFEATKN